MWITNDYIDEELVNKFKEDLSSQDVEVFALLITDMQCFSSENNIYVGVSLFEYKKLLLFSLNPSTLKVGFCKHVYVGNLSLFI